MCHGRQQDTGDEDDDQAAVKSVEARKELSAEGHRHGHRAHAAKSMDAFRNASIQLIPSNTR